MSCAHDVADSERRDPQSVLSDSKPRMTKSLSLFASTPLLLLSACAPSGTASDASVDSTPIDAGDGTDCGAKPDPVSWQPPFVGPGRYECTRYCNNDTGFESYSCVGGHWTCPPNAPYVVNECQCPIGLPAPCYGCNGALVPNNCDPKLHAYVCADASCPVDASPE